MTPEQLAKATRLRDRLLDVVLDEADPDNWSGNVAGAPHMVSAKIGSEDRGDRDWCLKIALKTAALYQRVSDIVDERYPKPPGAGDDAIDDDIKRAEREAAKLLKRASERQKNAAG
jgi:hypothetical protein